MKRKPQPRVTVYVPAVSLMALRQLAPHAFYLDQHWYVGEPFARAPVTPRRYELTSSAPAACWAAAYLEAREHGEPFECFSWTGDRDGSGCRVYVQTSPQGFQIHRHLTELPK